MLICMNPRKSPTHKIMSGKKIKVIGDLINNAYGRARKAWTTRNLEGYQKLAKSQEEDGAIALDVNIDGTQVVSVKQEEMLSAEKNDRSGIGVHYVDAYIKPMKTTLEDGTRVTCKRRGLKVTLSVGDKKGIGLMRRLDVSEDPSSCFKQPFKKRQQQRVSHFPSMTEPSLSNPKNSSEIAFL